MGAVSNYYSTIKKAAYHSLLYAGAYVSRTDLKAQMIVPGSFLLLASAFAAMGLLQLTAVFLGAGLAAYSLPKITQIYESRINFAKLEPYFITQKRLTELEQQINAKNYSNFLEYVKVIAEDNKTLRHFDEAHFIPWFLSQVEKLITNSAIDDKLCDKLHQSLASLSAFFSKSNTLILVSKEGWPVAINRYAFLLTSFKYRQQIKSTYVDANPSWMVCPSNYKALIQFDHYLSAGKVDVIPLDVALDLLKMASYFCVNSLEATMKLKAKQIIEEHINRIDNQKALENILETITSNIDNLGDEDWCARAQFQALSAFFSLNKSLVPCFIEDGCINVPSDQLYLLFRPEFEIIKEFNCISFDSHNLNSELQNLKLYPHGLTHVTSICFNDECNYANNVDEFLKLFPNLKTIYIIVNRSFNVKQIEKLIEKHKNIDIKVVIYNNLLKEENNSIYIQDVTLFDSLVDKFQMINVNERTVLLLGSYWNRNSLLNFKNKYTIEGYSICIDYTHNPSKLIYQQLA